MRLCNVITCLTLLSQLLLVFVLNEVPSTEAAPQEPSFELPVELIGFPVIILAVRLTNFVKKLAYSLNPKTYTSRTRRDLSEIEENLIDAGDVEKKLIHEFGNHVCIYEKVCTQNAVKALNYHGKFRPEALDWDEVLNVYKSAPDNNKQFYLLSVFLGDIVASPQLCSQLAKRPARVCHD